MICLIGRVEVGGFCGAGMEYLNRFDLGFTLGSRDLLSSRSLMLEYSMLVLQSLPQTEPRGSFVQAYPTMSLGQLHSNY